MWLTSWIFISPSKCNFCTLSMLNCLVYHIQLKCGLICLLHNLYTISHPLFFFFPCTWAMQKFSGQGSNPCHCSDQNHCSDNAGSLIYWAPRDLPFLHPLLKWGIYVKGLRGSMRYLVCVYPLSDFNAHKTYVGILLKCWFWLGRSGIELETLNS